jgi:Delta14-sterol reductase
MTERTLRPRNKDGSANITPKKATLQKASTNTIKYIQSVTTKYEFMGPHGALFTLLGLPFAVVTLNLFCDQKGCPPMRIWDRNLVSDTFLNANYWNFNAFLVYVGWLLFHLILCIVAPGETVQGAVLVDGSTLPYKINGFSSMLASLLLLACLVIIRGLQPLIWLADHYFQLASAGIIFCTVFSCILYAYSHRSSDVILAAGGNSGWIHYDLWMGRELNPRILNLKVDLKFVCELRPGLIGWFILDLAFAAKQYSVFGTVTNSMILVILGQGYYVLDAIWNEKAILTTMDITTDGFGFSFTN